MSLHDLTTPCPPLLEVEAKLVAERDAALAALRKYGHHIGCPEPDDAGSCDRWVAVPSNDSGVGLDHSKPCTCGLLAALGDEP